MLSHFVGDGITRDEEVDQSGSRGITLALPPSGFALTTPRDSHQRRQGGACAEHAASVGDPGGVSGHQ